MAIVEHARRELELCGLTDRDPARSAAIITAIEALTAYQGDTIGAALEMLNQMIELLRYRSLTPLTSDSDEWLDRASEVGYPLWQSNRDAAAFSRDGGASWYFIDGRPSSDDTH